MKRTWLSLLALMLAGTFLFAGAPGALTQGSGSMEIWLEESGSGSAELLLDLDLNSTVTIDDAVNDLLSLLDVTINAADDLGLGYYTISYSWTDFLGAFPDGQWTVENGFALISLGDMSNLDWVTVHLPGEVATVGDGDITDPYTVVFSNTSLTGISFAVSGPVSPTPTPTTSPRPTPTTSPRPTPATSPRPTPTTSPRPTPATSPRPTPTTSPRPTPTTSPRPTTEGGGFPWWAIVAIAGGAVLLLLVIILLLLIRRRPPTTGYRPPSAGATPPPSPRGSQGTRFCSNCGVATDGRMSFCSSCGASQKEPEPSPVPPSVSAPETTIKAEEDSISHTP